MVGLRVRARGIPLAVVSIGGFRGRGVTEKQAGMEIAKLMMDQGGTAPQYLARDVAPRVRRGRNAISKQLMSFVATIAGCLWARRPG